MARVFKIRFIAFPLLILLAALGFALCFHGLSLFVEKPAPEPAAEPDTPPLIDAGKLDMEQNSVELRVIMYHSVLQDPERAGKYVVPPSLVEQDLLYLKEAGYTSVTPMELVNFTRSLGNLPEKPVLITFDDGFYNNYVYALPILERLDMHAVISVVGSLTDKYSVADDRNPMYAYLGWLDICALRDSGRISIGNHTYGLHTLNNGRNGVKRKPGEDVGKHRTLLLEDIGSLQAKIEEHCGFMPIVFTYPFGAIDESSDAVIRELGFLIGLTCYERANIITRDPECLFQLGRYNRAAGESTEQFMRRFLGD